MTTDFEIITREKETTLEVSASATMLGIASVVKKGYLSILAHLSREGKDPCGVPYVRYLDIDWDQVSGGGALCACMRALTTRWKMKIGFPVNVDASAMGDIEKGEIPEGRYAKMLHKGPYHRVGKTYGDMLAEIRRQELSIKNESIEIYLNDPATTKTKDLETLVLIPLS